MRAVNDAILLPRTLLLLLSYYYISSVSSFPSSRIRNGRCFFHNNNKNINVIDNNGNRNSNNVCGNSVNNNRFRKKYHNHDVIRLLVGVRSKESRIIRNNDISLSSSSSLFLCKKDDQSSSSTEKRRRRRRTTTTTTTTTSNNDKQQQQQDQNEAERKEEEMTSLLPLKSSNSSSSLPSLLSSSPLSPPPVATASPLPICHESTSSHKLIQVESIYGSRAPLFYDPELERYVIKSEEHLQEKEGQHAPSRLRRDRFWKRPQSLAERDASKKQQQRRRSKRRTRLSNAVIDAIHSSNQFYHQVILPRLSVAFIPQGVTKSWHSYTKWRLMQRLINANLHVLGTQSLLMALGVKTAATAAAAAGGGGKTAAAAISATTIGLSAAIHWILKDALGKIVRMGWASKMGSKFDADAKRWRYRASFINAIGNGLEIVTYLVPSFFLLWAAAGNCCKEMCYLTCSATKTSISNTFRDGTKENLADITAKGEASAAIVDLIGIGTGVLISSLFLAATSRKSVLLLLYLILQTSEQYCLYHMVKSVQFRVFNIERLLQVLDDFIHRSIISDHNSSHNKKTGTGTNNNSRHKKIESEIIELPPKKRNTKNHIRTPEQIASVEKIFFPPDILLQPVTAFGSLCCTKLSPNEVTRLLHIFQNEKFILVVGPNHKSESGGTKRKSSNNASSQSCDTTTTAATSTNKVERNSKQTTACNSNSNDISTKSTANSNIQENCHIVLHTEANNADIVKSLLALSLLRKKLQIKATIGNDNNLELYSSDCYDIIQHACHESDQLFPHLLEQLNDNGWTSPVKYLFGRITLRTEWSIIGL